MPFLALPDGADLHYIDAGAKTAAPILLIHGEPFSTWFWQRNILAIAECARVVAYDARGRGRSTEGAGTSSVPQFAADLHEVITALGLESAIAVGWSLGAATIWSYLEQFGGAHLRGYINVDQRPVRTIGAVEVERLEQIRTMRRQFHLNRIRDYLGPNFATSDDVLDEMADECMKTSTESHISAVADVYARDFRKIRAAAVVPARTFWARHGWIDQTTMVEMAREAPGDWVLFARSGHLLPWTEPEQFNREVVAFRESLVNG